MSKQILVMGMHRSGTSMVSRILNLMGCYYSSEDQVMLPAEDNPKGFWERKDVMDLNNKILHDHQATWNDPYKLKDIKINSLLYSKDIKNIIYKLEPHRPWFIKDPRFCLTYKCWANELEHNLNIVVLRNPLAVSISLFNRNKISYLSGLALWDFYTDRLIKNLYKKKTILCFYDDFLQDPYKASENLFNSLKKLELQKINMPIKEEVMNFVDKQLNRSKLNSNIHLFDQDVIDFYTNKYNRIKKFNSNFSTISQSFIKTEQQTKTIEQQTDTIEKLDLEIKKIMSSNSYKYTAPLRKLRRIATNFINKLKKIINIIVAYLIISGKSFIMLLKFFGKSSKTHFEKPYQGQKILLLALYQTERLRPDIANLLIVAKQLGMYVMAINTLKILDLNSLKEKVDCYIERPNFGQDFGSYKTGFLHLFKQGWEKQCQRLIMLNDSVFYSKQNLNTFLNQMTNTDIEALGATENYQIEHHLQSFCISISKVILEQAKFKKYWKYYQCSNYRPNVIKLGEIKLSKIIKSCVSSPQQMSALFSAQWLSDYFKNNSSVNINEVLKFCEFENDILFLKKKNNQFSLSNNNKLNFLNEKIDDISNLSYLKQNIKEVEQCYIEIFLTTSPIHHLGTLLFYLGVPVIKLDGFYRGTLQIKNIQKISNRLDLEEGRNFKQLILRRPFGGDTLKGWKLAAFSRGYI